MQYVAILNKPVVVQGEIYKTIGPYQSFDAAVFAVRDLEIYLGSSHNPLQAEIDCIDKLPNFITEEK